MSAQLPTGEGQGTVRSVCVKAVFHVHDDHQAQVVAARMIDSAHEIANLPECECDVDVSLERTLPNLAHPVGPSDVPARPRPSTL
jgi:hypothetical protein